MLEKPFENLYSEISRQLIFLYGENSVRRNIRTVKYPTAKFLCGEISLRRNFLMVKSPSGETFYAKFPTAKFPTAKFQVKIYFIVSPDNIVCVQVFALLCIHHVLTQSLIARDRKSFLFFSF